MKIYIMTDLEGVAGVVQWEERKDESRWNIRMREQKARLLTAEVNAAVEGALEGGATEILVDDAHGGAYTINFEDLHERARVLHGRERPRIMAGMDESFAGMLFVGAHAMARTRGAVLYHTMSRETREIRINGRPIGEIGIFAFVAGAFGVPALMVTGDTLACREAAALIPGVVTVTVKEGLSRYASICQSAKTSRRMIREGARDAVRRRAAVKPVVFQPPFTYQEDTFTGEGDVQVSSPAKLPTTWTTGEEVRAATARELIDKVWGRDV